MPFLRAAEACATLGFLLQFGPNLTGIFFPLLSSHSEEKGWMDQENLGSTYLNPKCLPPGPVVLGKYCISFHLSVVSNVATRNVHSRNGMGFGMLEADEPEFDTQSLHTPAA